MRFYVEPAIVDAVNNLSFSVERGSILGIVGESGSGKSVTALTIMGLLASPPGRVDAGQIILEGTNLLGLSPDQMRQIRGRRVSMIYQDPMTSLNPVLRVGFQIAEAAMSHDKVPRKAAEAKAVELMASTGIPEPEKRASEYPHQFSGGMRQRIMIAMALATKPDLLIADEPTTALDVITQAQILSLLNRLRKELGMTVILITHDLGIAAELCDEILVMYAGQGMEFGSMEDIFKRPQHPYTIGLLNSITRVDRDIDRLVAIPGEVARLTDPPKGCRFHPRCAKVLGQCAKDEPPNFRLARGRTCKCWLVERQALPS